jgi:hypothetical protein
LQALTTASHSTENHTAMLTSNPVSVPSSPAPRAVVAASMASIPRRLAAAATSLARSASGSQLSSADGKKSAAGGGGDREETKTTTTADAKDNGEVRTEVGAVLKQDLAGALCVAAVVGANISSGGLLEGSYWTAAVVVLSVLLLLKIIYDASRYYMLQKKSKEHVE